MTILDKYNNASEHQLRQKHLVKINLNAQIKVGDSRMKTNS